MINEIMQFEGRFARFIRPDLRQQGIRLPHLQLEEYGYRLSESSPRSRIYQLDAPFRQTRIGSVLSEEEEFSCTVGLILFRPGKEMFLGGAERAEAVFERSVDVIGATVDDAQQPVGTVKVFLYRDHSGERTIRFDLDCPVRRNVVLIVDNTGRIECYGNGFINERIREGRRDDVHRGLASELRLWSLLDMGQAAVVLDEIANDEASVDDLFRMVVQNHAIQELSQGETDVITLPRNRFRFINALFMGGGRTLARLFRHGVSRVRSSIPVEGGLITQPRSLQERLTDQDRLRVELNMAGDAIQVYNLGGTVSEEWPLEQGQVEVDGLFVEGKQVSKIVPLGARVELTFVDGDTLISSYGTNYTFVQE